MTRCEQLERTVRELLADIKPDTNIDSVLVARVRLALDGKLEGRETVPTDSEGAEC